VCVCVCVCGVFAYTRVVGVLCVCVCVCEFGVVCVESVSVWRRDSESLSPSSPINASVVTIVLNHSIHVRDWYPSLHLPFQAELRNDVLYLLPHPPPVAPLRIHYCPL